MRTVTADENKRVQIPDAEAKQVFAYERDAQGTIHLIPIVAKPSEPAKVKVEKRGGYTVGVTDQPISLTGIKEALAEFP